MIVNCPACGQSMRSPDELAGATLRCVSCAAEFRAPAALAPAVAYGQEPPPEHRDAPRRRVSGLAITALVLGILSLLFCWFPIVPAIVGVVAFVLGIVALVTISPNPALSGTGFATSGLVTGLVGAILGLCFLFFVTIPYAVPLAECHRHIEDAVAEVRDRYGSAPWTHADFPVAGGRALLDALRTELDLAEDALRCPVTGDPYLGPRRDAGEGLGADAPLIGCARHSFFTMRGIIAVRADGRRMLIFEGDPDFGRVEDLLNDE